MSKESIIIIVLISVVLAAILGCIIFIGTQVAFELKSKRKLQEIALYSELFSNTNKIYELLDSYIQERFNEYKIFHIELTEKNITSAEQTKIVKELTMDILDTMSPAFYRQLTLVFNPDIEKITKLINNRVIMAVLDFSVENNTHDMDISAS